MIRRTLAIGLALWCLAVGGEAAPPDVTATSAILVEATTGRVVYEKEAEKPAYPASMTKMMTCILALEKGADRETVYITPEAAGEEDSALGLKPGETINGGELLKGLMMVSDNGAAHALAESMSGSVPAFAAEMNAKGEALGLRHTHFVNPHGLPHPEHYSTARDMAAIAAYGLRKDDFRRLVGERQSAVHWLTPAGKTYIAKNTNDLLWTYPGCYGIKTGWTQAAGGCLAAAAKRGSVELVAIVMHSTDADTRFTDAAKLLDYGFSQVHMKKGVTRENASRQVMVVGGVDWRLAASPPDDIFFPVIAGEVAPPYTLSYHVPTAVTAPIRRGEQLGYVAIDYDGDEIGRVPLLADRSVNGGFSFLSFFLGLFAKTFHII